MLTRDGDAMMRDRRSRAALVALLAALAACGGGRGMRYQDPKMDFGAIRTVAVMPFANLSRDNLAADRVRDVFATELLATGAVYVIPAGEVTRAIGAVGVAMPQAPSAEDIVKLGTALKADGIIAAVVKEYGEVRSGAATSNVVSMSVQLFETGTGRVVWAGSTTRGGVTFGDRLLGGGGRPLNDVTEAAVDDILGKMLD